MKTRILTVKHTRVLATICAVQSSLNEANPDAKTLTFPSNSDDLRIRTKFLLVWLCAFAWIDAFALAQSPGVKIANGFDYPVGSRGYTSTDSGTRKEPLLEGFAPSLERNSYYESGAITTSTIRIGDTSEWYNAQDTGSYYSALSGFHPAEDWNCKPRPRGDVGKLVFCAAHGEVKGIKELKYPDRHDGWLILIRHWLPDTTPNNTTDNKTIDTLYLHVAPVNINGSPNTAGAMGKLADFGLSVDMPVSKGQAIARVAGLTVSSPHLHFELRDKVTSTSNIWPNDNGNGYYVNHSKMRLDGVLDASDFIDLNRTLYSMEDLQNLKLTHPNRLEMKNCVSLGIMNNTDERAWLAIERALTRGEVIGLLKNAAEAFNTNYFHTMPNVNAVPAFTGDAELAASDLYNSVQLFAGKGLVDVSQPRFRVNDSATFGEAIHFLWRTFKLEEGGGTNAEGLFIYRRDKLKNAFFLRPSLLDFDLTDATLPHYSRVGGTLTRNLTARRNWLHQRGIGDLNFNYAEPIRRHVMAKLIMNTLLWRISNPTSSSL